MNKHQSAPFGQLCWGIPCLRDVFLWLKPTFLTHDDVLTCQVGMWHTTFHLRKLYDIAEQFLAVMEIGQGQLRAVDSCGGLARVGQRRCVAEGFGGL